MLNIFKILLQKVLSKQRIKHKHLCRKYIYWINHVGHVNGALQKGSKSMHSVNFLEVLDKIFEKY